MSRSALRPAPAALVLTALLLAACAPSGPAGPIDYVDYTGTGRPGAEYIEGLGTRFVVYAPTVSSLSVRGDFNGWGNTAMAEAASPGWWTAVAEYAAPGHEYKYWSADFTENGGYVGDPYGAAFDAEYTNAIILDPSDPSSPAHHDWTTTSWTRPPRDRLVIYELHVEDFADSAGSTAPVSGGAFRKAIERIPYLVDLGVNAVELMPVQEWPGADYSWGYNTSHWSAPENSCGSSAADGSTVGDLKALVDSLHGAGIAVIMDVVYNHSSHENPLWAIDAERYFEGDTPWGPRFDLSEPASAAYVRDNLKLWLDEYSVDGFRFDSTENLDAAALIGIVDGLRAEYPGRYWIFEEFNGDHNNLIKAYDNADGSGVIASWGAGWKDTVWGSLFDTAYGNLGTSTYHAKDWGWTWPSSVINYHSSHDERTIQGVGWWFDGKIAPAGPAVARLAATHLLTAMGIPMLWMGEEVGRVHYGNNTTNATSSANNAVPWTTLEIANAALKDYYAGLIALRIGHKNLHVAESDPALSGAWSWNMTDTAGQPNTWGSGALAWVSKGAGDNAFAVFLNFTGDERFWTASFPADGNWILVADSNPAGDGLVDAAGTGTLGTIAVSGNTATVTVAAGRALVYMSPEAMP
ncbi:MAG: hypothetical protein JXA15_12220 [Spirochaetales bacterium]|nr:hypothetical protein [Spirochaetales bacterium]